MPEPTPHRSFVASDQDERAVRGGWRRASDAALDGVVQVFQPMSAAPLTRDDAQEITENLGKFFEILERWAIEDAARGKGPLASRLRALGLSDLPEPNNPPLEPPEPVRAAGGRGGRPRRGGAR